MKKVVLDGKECLCILERGWGDGGAVVNYFIPQGDGTFENYREWYSDPVVARAKYAGADDVQFRRTKAEIAKGMHRPIEETPLPKKPV